MRDTNCGDKRQATSDKDLKDATDNRDSIRAPLLNRILLLPIAFYRGAISPWLPRRCRHIPTCSEYAAEALRTLPAGRALWLTFKRVLRCRPRGSWGYDPVPKSSDERRATESNK